MKIRTAALLGLGLLCVSAGPALALEFKSGALLGEPGSRQDKVSFGPQNNFTQPRQELQVPKAYGRLIIVTTENNATIFWYESLDGEIRNVAINGADPVVIKRTGELR